MKLAERGGVDFCTDVNHMIIIVLVFLKRKLFGLKYVLGPRAIITRNSKNRKVNIAVKGYPCCTDVDL